jgi:uncharacterized protein YqeY
VSEGSIPEQVKAAMKAAMKARDKERLATIRLIQAEFKRVEVDERIDIDDARALTILDKMVKQRRDSQAQYEDAGRAELAAQEASEIDVITEFLPTPLSDAELEQLVEEAIAASGAGGMHAMGAVMGELKPKLAGRADMGAVSKLVKARLSG